MNLRPDTKVAWTDVVQISEESVYEHDFEGVVTSADENFALVRSEEFMRLNGVASTHVPIDRLTILIDKPSEKISSAVKDDRSRWGSVSDNLNTGSRVKVRDKSGVILEGRTNKWLIQWDDGTQGWVDFDAPHLESEEVIKEADGSDERYFTGLAWDTNTNPNAIETEFDGTQKCELDPTYDDSNEIIFFDEQGKEWFADKVDWDNSVVAKAINVRQVGPDRVTADNSHIPGPLQQFIGTEDTIEDIWEQLLAKGYTDDQIQELCNQIPDSDPFWDPLGLPIRSKQADGHPDNQMTGLHCPNCIVPLDQGTINKGTCWLCGADLSSLNPKTSKQAGNKSDKWPDNTFSPVGGGDLESGAAFGLPLYDSNRDTMNAGDSVVFKEAPDMIPVKVLDTAHNAEWGTSWVLIEGSSLTEVSTADPKFLTKVGSKQASEDLSVGDEVSVGNISSPSPLIYYNGVWGVVEEILVDGTIGVRFDQLNKTEYFSSNEVKKRTESKRATQVIFPGDYVFTPDATHGEVSEVGNEGEVGAYAIVNDKQYSQDDLQVINDSGSTQWGHV